jgi:addiction module HigA family antidote
MTRKLPKRGLPPMHPGELLREEILPALDRSKTEIARLLGVSRQTLYDVLKEKQPVTPGMALRLGKLCGNGPDLWLNLQKRYDLHHAQQELGTSSSSKFCCLSSKISLVKLPVAGRLDSKSCAFAFISGAAIGGVMRPVD